jgi:signal peptidase II
MQVLALLLSALLLIILDQSSKALVRHRIAPRQVRRVGVIAIRYHLNRRAFGESASNVLLLLAVLSAVLMGLFAATLFAPALSTSVAAVALGIAAGGASSNVIDQVLHQGVVDFIDLGWWPVFNLADVAIVVGATSALACFVIPLATARLGTA